MDFFLFTVCFIPILLTSVSGDTTLSINTNISIADELTNTVRRIFTKYINPIKKGITKTASNGAAALDLIKNMMNSFIGRNMEAATEDNHNDDFHHDDFNNEDFHNKEFHNIDPHNEDDELDENEDNNEVEDEFRASSEKKKQKHSSAKKKQKDSRGMKETKHSSTKNEQKEQEVRRRY